MNARTLILATGAALALSVPAANAATHRKALPQSKLHVAPVTNTHQKVGKTKTRTPGTKTVTPAKQPAAPGSGPPILATTADDYDNPLIAAQQPEVASSTADSPIGVLPSPSLTDGYLR